MESQLSADENKNSPLPIITHEWEDLRKAREAGGYPWTHLLKAPLEGEITAEDIIRSTSPRRSMSREFSKSRTHSPVDETVQKILNLDSSPGSSRKHGEEGEDEGVHIPNFSKEISLDSDEDVVNQALATKQLENQNTQHLISPPTEIPKNVSPKSILKRRTPEPQYFGSTETREKTKCCHPLVNKLKHLADKTLHKLERNDHEKSPQTKRKKAEEPQEIRQLKNSPSAIRRQKFSAIKLGDSDEMSRNMSIDIPTPLKKKEHIYEDIEESKEFDNVKSLQDPPDIDNDDLKTSSNKENDSLQDKKSNTSQDPSLIIEDNASLDANEHVMEKLHQRSSISKEVVMLDEEIVPAESNTELMYKSENDIRKNNESPNITITEINDDDITIEPSSSIPIESSPSPSPRVIDSKQDFMDTDWSRPNRPTREGSVQLYTPEVRCACQFFQCDSLLPERINPVGTRPTSRASNIIQNISDHEYEIIEKPPPNIIYTAPSIDNKPNMVVTDDDELSSISSLEKKYLHHTSDEDEPMEHKEQINCEKDENISNAEALQKGIEERFFVNTPSTTSRTECEVSTSQVDSSALENLPLKRSSRNKNSEGIESKIQQRIKEGTGKIKSQAGKLKTKLNTIKNKQMHFPERSKIKLQEKPKPSNADRSKSTLPEKRKFSLPDRPKFKKINFSEKLSFGDRKKFSFPERPKFNMPDLPKFKMPERPKINFPSLGRKKVDINKSESSSDLQNVSVEFEAKTYPRLFNRKKQYIPKTSSSPTLNREDTPPATFTFTRVKKATDNQEPSRHIPDSPEEPREYGSLDKECEYTDDYKIENRQNFCTTYDFDKVDQVDQEFADETNSHDELRIQVSESDISPPLQENTHINELNNDEFFVRPRGISRENIQVREYLSDEIRQAFKIPKNVLADMSNEDQFNNKNIYANDPEDHDIALDGQPISYSTEDINDRDDGYYTFPPVRPSRAKRKKKDAESIKYIDDSINASMQFSEVDLDLRPTTDLHSIHEYANDDVIEYPDSMPIQSQTLPMPPRRKKKSLKTGIRNTSLNDVNMYPAERWQSKHDGCDDIIVYRTEHEYIVPQADLSQGDVTEQSPLPPRRNRSRSSRTTSVCDDDRTSHGAESLILDAHISTADNALSESDIQRESPGYATVDKGNFTPSKGARRSLSKTPPARRRKSNSSERKYYTVSSQKSRMPDRPPRKKSSTSLMTLDSFTKESINGDQTQYVEIDRSKMEDSHKDLKSGAIVSKMKDRPLPPPPRPPRGPKRKKLSQEEESQKSALNLSDYLDVVEIEVSTQTDPLPDDVDFEFGIDDNLDLSMSSSLRDIIDEESILGKIHDKSITLEADRRSSRPASRSEKSLKLSDPKLGEFSKSSLGKTSPTVILVEKRVSSPTRIDEKEVILTEASLTVQPIDIDDSQVPDVPPLPKSRDTLTSTIKPRTEPEIPESEKTLDKIAETNKDILLDNLVTQRLQVRDLDVGRLNVSELQASKILVSDIEGMTLNVNELDSKSGHISITGIEFSQSVIDEIVKKFTEMSTSIVPNTQIVDTQNIERPISREEETQTDTPLPDKKQENIISEEIKIDSLPSSTARSSEYIEEITVPPQRPPPPDLTPLLYSYLQDLTITSSLPHQQPILRERHYSDFHEPQLPSPQPPTRRAKRKPPVLHSESSSDDVKPRPSPRRMPPPARTQEPTITEAGVQFLRVCQNSISRTFRNIVNTFTSYISGTQNKHDMQVAMVIFLVLIAGLIMFGLSDSRTIHHHHWEFFNPPDNKQ
ncbi:hypothetical protein KGM_208372 [Danaus plexippus plexippus]|uniref:Titin n=1 Tax=Danaus plexippus plexippus TaxID=278856 RepID=A0A212FKK5_DANPL|nr:hypothetical protein KGM_208372 [Danaus plexippus plexippus]